MQAQIRVLGTLEVARDGVAVPVARGQQARLLAVLVLALGKPVTAEALAAAIWSESPPRNPEQGLYPVLSRLRKLLEPAGAAIRSAGGGYTLECPPEQVDLWRFDQWVAQGRAALRAREPQRAATLLTSALALFRGDALPDLEGGPFDDERRRLELEQLTARTDLFEARLALGHDRELVGELELLVARHPLHEPAAAHLILALYRSGQQAAAMQVYHRLAGRLAEELGQPPGPRLTELYERILVQDSELQAPLPAGDVWNLPPDNPRFTGRADQLRLIEKLLLPAGAVVLHGLPGIGKTQLALRYAYTCQAEIVWWCPAESAGLVDVSLARLAARLGVEVPGDLEATRLALRRTLGRRPGWLLVFDNAEDVDAIRSWLPPQDAGQTLITSRNPDWHGYAKPIGVPVFAREESVELLHQRTGAAPPAALRLAERLGDLPLALEQAAAFCEKTGESLDAYLRFLVEREPEMLARGRLPDYPGTVAATCRIAFERVARDEPRAITLLQRVAFLAADAIPLTVLGRALPGSGADGPDDLDLAEVVGALMRYSLVDRVDQQVSVHRLVQSLVRAGLTGDERRTGLDAVTAALAAAAPSYPHGLDDWPRWDPLVPHVVALIGHADAAGVWPAQLGPLACRAASYLDERGAYAAASRLIGTALKAADHAGWDDAVGRAELLTVFGRVLDRAGCELHGAQDLLRAALRILESTPGVSDLALGCTLSRLAHALHCADLEGEALGVHERAVALLATSGNQSVYGHALTDQGYSFWKVGDLAAAETAFLTAVEILGAALGGRHPQVAVARSGLGMVWQDQGDLDGARDQLERALADLQIVYPDAGDAHPDIAQMLDKLGYLRQLRGDVEGALECHGRAVAALEQLFGAHDPRTAMAVTNLGLDQLRAGDRIAARASQRRAVAVFVSTYGDDHSSTVIAADRLAQVDRELASEG